MMHVLENYNPPTEPWLDVVYVDDDIVVLNKPSGLLTVPGKPENHHDCLESRVKERYVGARIIHRLDMDTSGLIVMARHKEAQAHIGKQFEKRETEKTYTALLQGLVEEDEGEIDLPLICDWPNRPKQMVDHERGKPALTLFRVEERLKHRTRVIFKPVTGRSHQLRVHALSMGHPIVGDRLYGQEAEKYTESRHRCTERLFLHAARLSLKHPVTNAPMQFVSLAPF